jgi:hypothetical protein
VGHVCGRHAVQHRGGNCATPPVFTHLYRDPIVFSKPPYRPQLLATSAYPVKDVFVPREFIIDRGAQVLERSRVRAQGPLVPSLRRNF